nr:MAG TPA: hypothetical protein [Caudoviricetes sp.]
MRLAERKSKELRQMDSRFPTVEKFLYSYTNETCSYV